VAGSAELHVDNATEIAAEEPASASAADEPALDLDNPGLYLDRELVDRIGQVCDDGEVQAGAAQGLANVLLTAHFSPVTVRQFLRAPR
jgi:hypothetical protein